MKVVVSTYDKNSWLIPGFAYLFNKYWSDKQPVTVIGFGPLESELPDNFTFESMAPKENLPWTDHHKAWLEKQGSEPIILLLDDYWLVQPVRLGVITMLHDAVLSFADKAELNADMTGKHNTKYGFHPVPMTGGSVKSALIISPPNSRYRTSLQPAIWSMSFLLYLMVEGRDPWEFEMKGDELTREATIIAPAGIRARTQPYPLANICHIGKVNRRAVKRIHMADRVELAKLGYSEMFDEVGVRYATK